MSLKKSCLFTLAVYNFFSCRGTNTKTFGLIASENLEFEVFFILDPFKVQANLKIQDSDIATFFVLHFGHILVAHESNFC